MKNLTHLIRIQEKLWINPAHIIKIKMEEKNELELCITLTGGPVIAVLGDYAQKLLASLQAAD